MWCVQTTKNFGGKEEGAVAAVSNLFTRMGRLKPSAYMLVYVREKGIRRSAHPLHGQASVCCLAQAAPPSMRLASLSAYSPNTESPAAAAARSFGTGPVASRPDAADARQLLEPIDMASMKPRLKPLSSPVQSIFNMTVHTHPPPEPPPAPPAAAAGPSAAAAGPSAAAAVSPVKADTDETEEVFHDAVEAVASDEDSAKSAPAEEMQNLSVAASCGNSEKIVGSGSGSSGAAAKEKRPESIQWAVMVSKDTLTAWHVLTRLTHLNSPPPPLDRSNLAIAAEWGEPGMYLFLTSKNQARLSDAAPHERRSRAHRGWLHSAGSNFALLCCDKVWCGCSASIQKLLVRFKAVDAPVRSGAISAAWHGMALHGMACADQEVV